MTNSNPKRAGPPPKMEPPPGGGLKEAGPEIRGAVEGNDSTAVGRPDFDFHLGYAPLPRSIRNHPIMRRPEALQLYIWVLCQVTHVARLVDTPNGGTLYLEPGQWFLGQESAAERLGFGGRQTVRSLLHYLVRYRLIARKPTTHGTVITILGYGDFKTRKKPKQPTGNQRLTKDQPLSNGINGLNGDNQREREKVFVSPPSIASEEEIQIAARVLGKLSQRTGATFSHERPEYLALIVARLREGYTERDLRLVVWQQCKEWLESEKFRSNLRPSVLFGKKFVEYLDTAGADDDGSELPTT